MSPSLLVKLAALALWATAAVYIHFRGKVRHRLRRQLTDHSTFFAPYNALVDLLSATPRRPVLDPRDVPRLSVLRENWRIFRDEAEALLAAGRIGPAPDHDDIAFNTFFKRGWTRFYLKWYGDFLPSARALCPRSVAILEDLPEIRAALFAVMAPHSRLGEHRDPFAGSLRYHLGLITPNSDACRILVDGQPLSWRDGQDLLFDETYVHCAVNDTDQVRVILFCDVARPLRSRALRRVDTFVAEHLAKMTQSHNVPTERIGAVNRVAKYVFALKGVFQRAKKRNRRVYYAVKYAALGALAYLALRITF